MLLSLWGRTSEFAERGQLLILAGGDQKDVEAAQPVFDALGRETIYCGENGTRTMKVLNGTTAGKGF